jgi:glycosyltransferase involved in cell wall biosynthesis
MKSIIVPTRNRPHLLKRLVDVVVPQLLCEDELIIIDSSDVRFQSPNLNQISQIKYLTTQYKSAAVQRNIGLDEMGKSEYVFFLDDDVLPGDDYFARCIDVLNKADAIGVSGVAPNPISKQLRPRPAGLYGLYRRIFILDSKKDGVLLRSGINVPIRDYASKVSEVEWLIGCSAWKTEKTREIRFESDFKGQSLFEDVIFSVRMKKHGKIVTEPSIVLMHEESEIARPSKYEFWEMWMTNRYRLIKVANFGVIGNLSYWWANIGQFGILVYLKMRASTSKSASVKGLITGGLAVLRLWK